jgi:hypothetical protein
MLEQGPRAEWPVAGRWTELLGDINHLPTDVRPVTSNNLGSHVDTSLLNSPERPPRFTIMSLSEPN